MCPKSFPISGTMNQSAWRSGLARTRGSRASTTSCWRCSPPSSVSPWRAGPQSCTGWENLLSHFNALQVCPVNIYFFSFDDTWAGSLLCLSWDQLQEVGWCTCKFGRHTKNTKSVTNCFFFLEFQIELRVSNYFGFLESPFLKKVSFVNFGGSVALNL